MAMRTEKFITPMQEPEITKDKVKKGSGKYEKYKSSRTRCYISRDGYSTGYSTGQESQVPRIDDKVL